MIQLSAITTGLSGGNTWKYIYNKLSFKYEVRDQINSRHTFGILQHCARIYVVCKLKSKGGLNGFKFPEGEFTDTLSTLD